MRYFYLCLVALLITGSLSARGFKGYLITKNNYHLTGFIEQVAYTPFGIDLMFTNDFGTTYTIHPALVRGFAFLDESQQVQVYISQFYEDRWYFLRIEFDGEYAGLLEAPDLGDKLVKSRLGGAQSIQRYWLRIGQRTYQPVPRWGYRKQMRRLLGERLSVLDGKIGRAGYRYRDLPDIVREYNEKRVKRKKRI